MMIKLEHIKKTFNKHRKNKISAISDTSLQFNETGLTAILGPSGCGKTTLLNVIGGLDKIDKGNIYIDGIRMSHTSTYKKDKIRNLNIGYIFQDYKLIENMSVYDNVAIVLKMIGIKDHSEIEKRVLYTLEKVNMLRYKKRPVNMLSGGERQRVGIARAIVKNPKIIIADEPTGNLDSRNSIEIMNIIKKISENRLVILVTHERELAEFYANRIIEILDGKVINDYINNNTKKLNYRIDNKIYLKDFKYINNLNNKDININTYSDNLEDINIDLVFKNGNIYIKTNNSYKVELVENNIELVNDHYKELDSINNKELDFDIDSIINKKYKERYSSIFRLGNYIKDGFNKVINYPILKKLLLGGFFLSGMFIYLAVSYTLGSLNIQDKDFVNVNKLYLQAKVNGLSIDDYNELNNSNNINYILPSNSLVTFNLKDNNYYQTKNYISNINGSLSSIDMLNNKLLYGNMPTNNKEIVIDKLVLDNTIKNGEVIQIGISKPELFLNRKVSINNLGEFTIVGISNNNSPSIYVDNSMLIPIISQSKVVSDNDYIIQDNEENIENTLFIYDYDTSKYNLVKGVLPTNDYEIIVNKDLEYNYPLNKTINYKVNGKKLKVVGYFSTTENNYKNMYLTNINTINYKLLRSSKTISVYSNNNNLTTKEFLNKNINLTSSYNVSKDKYIEQNKKSLKKTLMISSIMIFISLLEIFLMIRSSFLSRVKEVGIYRAIGVKKSDIYKMFMGEIFAITSIACVLGILFMSYILYNLSNTELLQDKFMVNPFTLLLSIIFIYIFNILIGLLPVFKTMRKTPAEILSRTDI